MRKLETPQSSHSGARHSRIERAFRFWLCLRQRFAPRIRAAIPKPAACASPWRSTLLKSHAACNASHASRGSPRVRFAPAGQDPGVAIHPEPEPLCNIPHALPFDRLCCIASRVRSPIASRYHCETAVMMLITSLPAAEPVFKDSATEERRLSSPYQYSLSATCICRGLFA